MLDVIGHKWFYIVLSGVLVTASIAAVLWFGLPLGIDFTGGSLLEATFNERRPEAEELRTAFSASGVKTITIQLTGERGALFRFRDIDEETHRMLLNALGLSAVGNTQVPSDMADSRGDETRFSAIGPTVGRELLIRAGIAIAAALLAIMGYIAWAFRKVSAPVPSWRYGLAAVVALIHDVAIPIGVFAVLGALAHIEMDALFVTALLTIMGFSVHDTIVVFDRTRENLIKDRAREGRTERAGISSFGALVNRSINETLVRSVNTSLTVLFVLIAVAIFGGTTTRYFVVTLIVGIVAGAYSSIFLASPLLVLQYEWRHRGSAQTD